MRSITTSGQIEHKAEYVALPDCRLAGNERTRRLAGRWCSMLEKISTLYKKA
jgi:hypothetical protein